MDRFDTERAEKDAVRHDPRDSGYQRMTAVAQVKPEPNAVSATS